MAMKKRIVPKKWLVWIAAGLLATGLGAAGGQRQLDTAVAGEATLGTEGHWLPETADVEMAIAAAAVVPPVIQDQAVRDGSRPAAPAVDGTGNVAPDDGQVEPFARTGGYRSSRGTFRGGAGTSTGTRTGTGGGYTTGTRAPSSNVGQGAGAAAPRTGLGSFFGGLAAGSLLGGLLNPFRWGGGYGYGYGGGFSVFGLLFWAAVIYVVYRFFRGRWGRRDR